MLLRHNKYSVFQRNPATLLNKTYVVLAKVFKVCMPWILLLLKGHINAPMIRGFSMRKMTILYKPFYRVGGHNLTIDTGHYLLRSRSQVRGKLLLSRKLWHFSGSRFSQCFIPSTPPHFSSPSKVLC